MFKKVILLLSFFHISIDVISQNFIETKPDVYKKLNISGSYRFFVQHRHFVNPYITEVNGLDTAQLIKKSILVGDATQLPELTLNISANLSNNVSFGTDLTLNKKQATLNISVDLT